MGTGVTFQICSPEISNLLLPQQKYGVVVIGMPGAAIGDSQALVVDLDCKQSIRVVKRSSVSTGWLSALLHVHVRPINLVVFQGTFGYKPYET